jgi:predicted aconitase with swiveling domain
MHELITDEAHTPEVQHQPRRTMPSTVDSPSLFPPNQKVKTNLDVKVVSDMIEAFTRAVLHFMDQFHSRELTREAAMLAIESQCRIFGGVFAGENPAFEPAPWHGPRLAGKILALVPGVKGADVETTCGNYFRWLSVQIVKVHTAMNEGMIEEEAGPVIRVGMLDAVEFLTDHVTPQEKAAARGRH